MNKRNFAFGRMNFILLAVGMLVVIIGFILMGGDASTDEAYNPDIFSARRTKVAPIVCLIGFLSMVYAVVYKAKNETFTEEEPEEEEPVAAEQQPADAPATSLNASKEALNAPKSDLNAPKPAADAPKTLTPEEEMAERTRKVEERLEALRKLSAQARAAREAREAKAKDAEANEQA